MRSTNLLHLRPHLFQLAFSSILFCPLLLGPNDAHSQTLTQQEQSATYVSRADEELTIRKIGLLPVVDNVDGIYSRPIEIQLAQLIKGSHRWDYVETNIAGSMPGAIELEENPDVVKRTVRSIDADAFVTAALSKGPTGLAIRLDLFLKNDGKLVAQELLKDHPRFEINDVRARVAEMYAKLIAKLPYQGLILSRQGNRVTVNLGKSDRLVKDQTITAVQIISINRHPRFNFLISTEKEILGKIKILKVDDTLSFGAIVSEKEKGAIRRLAKISALEPVNYGEPAGLGASADSSGSLANRSDSKVSFGSEPREWLPVRPPSFGQVSMDVGFGTYSSAVNLGSTGVYEASSKFYPRLGISGELWISPEWVVRAEVSQGIISTPNPRSGSSPSELNHLFSRYGLELGHNFLLREDFFGPKFTLSVGLANAKSTVDDSTPTSLTSTNFSGTYVGLSGSLPIDYERNWYFGGRLNMFLLAKLDESPVTSGSSSKNAITEFNFYVENKIAENIRAHAGLSFSLHSASLSGAGTRTGPLGLESATSISHRHNVLSAGVTYMF